jgi:hypothetical protein
MPIKQAGYSQDKAHARKERKRKEADLRQGKYDALTLTEKIFLATSRGGSKREIERLQNPKAKPATPPAPVAVALAAEAFVSDKKRKGKKEVNAINKMARPAKS